jgi:hypothetical protein
MYEDLPTAGSCFAPTAENSSDCGPSAIEQPSFRSAAPLRINLRSRSSSACSGGGAGAAYPRSLAATPPLRCGDSLGGWSPVEFAREGEDSRLDLVPALAPRKILVPTCRGRRGCVEIPLPVRYTLPTYGVSDREVSAHREALSEGGGLFVPRLWLWLWLWPPSSACVGLPVRHSHTPYVYGVCLTGSRPEGRQATPMYTPCVSHREGCLYTHPSLSHRESDATGRAGRPVSVRRYHRRSQSTTAVSPSAEPAAAAAAAAASGAAGRQRRTYQLSWGFCLPPARLAAPPIRGTPT